MKTCQVWHFLLPVRKNVSIFFAGLVFGLVITSMILVFIVSICNKTKKIVNAFPNFMKNFELQTFTDTRVDKNFQADSMWELQRMAWCQRRFIEKIFHETYLASNWVHHCRTLHSGSEVSSCSKSMQKIFPHSFDNFHQMFTGIVSYEIILLQFTSS